MPDTPTSPATSSPRRAMTCKQCGRPRKGHPRSGCPFADEDEPATPTTPTAKPHSTRTLNNAMHTMQVVDVEGEKAERRRRRSSARHVPQRVETLASLDTEASLLVRNLAQPGIMSDIPATLEGRVSRWRMNIPGEFETPEPEEIPRPTSIKPITPKPRTQRPATPPVASTSKDKGKGREVQVVVEVPQPRALTRVKQAKPLGRTMSMEERESFIQNVQKNAKAGAQVFAIPKGELADMVKQAEKIGFYAASFWRAEAEDGYLVLGMNKGAVSELIAEVTEGKAQQGGSPLKTGMAGAAMGAAAMFAGLAYS